MSSCFYWTRPFTKSDLGKVSYVLKKKENKEIQQQKHIVHTNAKIPWYMIKSEVSVRNSGPMVQHNAYQKILEYVHVNT